MTSSKEAYILFEKTIEKSGVEITFELSKARAILMQSLDRLERLEKAQNIELDNLEFIESPNKYQTSIKMLKEAFIILGRGDIANACWFKYLEELEKENRELIRKADCCMWLECNKISEENDKFKNAIQQAIELLAVDGKGTKQEVKKMLSEVVENVK